MFAALHNLTGPDPYAVNDLGQECRTSLANEGPTVVLGCSAVASGAESCVACNGLNTHASGAEWCVHGWMDGLALDRSELHSTPLTVAAPDSARGTWACAESIKIVLASPDSTPRPARCTGKTWDTWMGKKVAVAKLEPYWENPYHAARGSTWGAKPQAGTGYY